MDQAVQESLRSECLAKARRAPNLVEEELADRWHFYRRGLTGPMLGIAKPGRRVIEIKGVKPNHILWESIDGTDPKQVGRAWEIRFLGNPATVRAAFDDGLAVLVALG